MRWTLILWIGMNIVGFVMTRYDKILAENNRWRVSESMLLMIALLGGGVGTCIAMFTPPRHKTNKSMFRIGVPIIIIVRVIFFFIFR